MKRYLLFLALGLAVMGGGTLFAQAIPSEFFDGIKIFDDADLIFGTDDDIQIVYDETTDNRLEVTDGTNMLMHLTDTGTEGDLEITGDMTADAFIGDGSQLTGLTVNPPIEDTVSIVYDADNNTREARIRATNVPNSTTIDVEWPSANLDLEPDVDLAAADPLLTDIAALSATKGNVLAGDGTDLVALAVGGTDDHVLTVDSGESTGLKYAHPLDSYTPTKGNLLVGNGTAFVSLGVGSNDEIPIADSASSTGIRWGVNSPGDGASTALDNLTSPTAINQTLTPGTDGAYNIGSGTARFNAAYIERTRTGTTAADTTLLQAYDVDGAVYTTFATLTANNTPTMDLAQAVTHNGETIANLGTAGVWTRQQNFGTATLTDAANISWALSTSQVATVTLGGNRTLDNPTNRVDGGTYILIVKQDGSGGHTLSFDTAYLFPGGTAPTLSTGANDVDIITFVSDGTNMYGVAVQDFS